ncbi:OmpA family protein [Lichenifustis flavocetrariae]|uniref:OmpA family protein n=1 Tax=Lichenifustis flavocetrariae TaxID=2949735 RepID=A0AA42CHJ5_9HYPH|nr:OmpA family protein [Lichenifustis flavocetrariae]MCW6507608.1 OmpA family protein [Lichenifustis flavocetrariae]
MAGAAAGFVGGFLAAQGLQRFDQVRAERQQFNNDGVDIIREPGRTIIEEDNRYYIAHDENERFRDLGYDVQSQRQGGYDVADYARPDGSRIFTYTDDQGRLIRRVRQFPDGRELILIDNRYTSYDRNFQDDVVDLPPPPIDLPPDRYVVDGARADQGLVYEALAAPPVAPLPRRYTLDQVRYSPDLRNRMRSVNLNSITFDTASWTVSPDQATRLAAIAGAINAAVRRDPREIFMVEGYTDAVGNAVDNLSLSDRRAQSVATILTRDFQVPAENLVTQGYGSQYPREQTQGPSAVNRRVAVRRITPLLANQ